MANFSRTTKETKDLAEKLFFTIQEELFRRETLNSDAYDKAILTYSSGALALSIGFLKDFAVTSESQNLWILFTSWALFVVAIFSTIIAFLFGKAANQRQLEKSELYYIHGHEPAIDFDNKWVRKSTIFNWSAGLSFALAALLTALFVSISIKEQPVKKIEPTQDVIQKIISGETVIMESFDPARMTRLPQPVDVAPTTPVAQSQTPAETSQQSSSGTPLSGL